MSALGKVVRAGVGRRRVQTVVMVLTTMTAVMASVMAAALVVASQAPFDHAFARQHGAHLGARFDGARADAAQVAATARVAGVTAAAGPFAVVSVAARGNGPAGMPPGDPSPMSIVGRTSPDGPVDRLTLTAGRWVDGPGEIVLADDTTSTTDQNPLGQRLAFSGLPGDPVLTVVGTAFSVSRSADAWVAPAEIAALTRPGTKPSYEMLYRFRGAGSGAAVARDRAAVAKAVPRGALTGAQSYLVLKETADRETATFIPFVVAFGVLGLVMAVLIIGIVVSGAVSAGTRRIGVLKSLGFTPAQVARAYVGQALIPSSLGIGLGVVLGDLAAVPLLGQTDNAYGTTSLSVAWWVDVAVPAGAVALVVAAALAPALRAARLRTVEAIATGRTPRVGRGRYAARLAARLPVARSLSLGLAAPFARPARSAVIGTAVVFGAIGVTFAFGLGASLTDIQHGINQDEPGQVSVGLYGPPPGGGSGAPAPPAAPDPAGSTSTAATTFVPVSRTVDPAAVTRVVAAQPGTRGYFSTAFTSAAFAGVTGTRTVVAYEGDSSGWGAYQMVSGHWFTGPGQLVAGRRFLEAAGIRVGDTVTLEGNGREARVRVVGEALETGDDGMRVMTDAATLTAAGLSVHPGELHVELAHGVDRSVYLSRLNKALKPLGVEAMPQDGEVSGTVIAMDTIITVLTLMLIAVAALGVLNTVVLDTRERIHDLGVLKALGMAPRQTVAMVVVSVAWIGAVAGLIGVPLGMALHRLVLPVMGSAAGTRIPAADMSVYHLPQLSLLAAAGLVIASAGAMLPAGWAARIRTAAALRTE